MSSTPKSFLTFHTLGSFSSTLLSSLSDISRPDSKRQLLCLHLPEAYTVHQRTIEKFSLSHVYNTDELFVNAEQLQPAGCVASALNAAGC